MIKRFTQRLTTLNAAYADPIERQQAQRLLMLNLLWLLLLVVVLPTEILWWGEDQNTGILRVIFPLMIVLVLFTHRQIKHGQERLAHLLFVLNIMALTLLIIFPNYRIDTPLIILLTVPLTAAGVLLRRGTVIGVTLVLGLSVAIGGIVQHNTDMAPTPIDSLQVTAFVVLTALVGNVLLLWTFANSLADTVHHQRRLNHLLEATTGISQDLVMVVDSVDRLNPLVEQLRDSLGLYHVQVFMSDPNSGLPVLQASTGFIGRRLLEENSLLTPDEDSPVNDALRRKDPILLTEADPESKRHSFLPATQSELLIPLRVGNLLPIGVLDLHSTQPEAFSRRVMDILAIISNQMAAALYSSQQTKELRAGYQERERMIEQLDASQRELARLNRQLVGTTWGTYLQERIDTVPGFDWSQGSILRSQDNSPALRQTLEDGEARLEKRDQAYILCVPIKLRGQTLGALEFQRTAGLGWSTAALELAQAVADRLALSLENARLFEQAQKTAQREQLVSHVTSELQTANDLQTLLSLAAARFQDALGASRTQVRLGMLPTTESSNDHTAQERT